MRKLFQSLSMAFVLAVMCSCGNREVQKFVTDFALACAAGNSAKMTQMYPDSKLFTATKLHGDSINITVDKVEGQEGVFKAMINNGIELLIKQSGETYQIESSRGLLQLPQNMSFAIGTGQYKTELTDVENAKRLNDKGFVMWVLNDVVKDLDNKVKVVSSDYEIVSRHATDWFDDAHTEPICEKYTANVKVTVQNELDTNISADAYSVVSSVYTVAYFTEPAKCQKTTNVETKTIAAHSSMVLNYSFVGEGDYVEGMGWIDHIKSVLSFNMQNLNTSALYKPRGGEYDEYIKNHSASDVASELNIVLHGQLGGDANSTFTLNGQEGSYIFVGASRQTKLVSYDPQSGKLVVDAYLNGSKIGYFDGTYSNGRYKGIFKNIINGGRLDFNLVG